MGAQGAVVCIASSTLPSVRNKQTLTVVLCWGVKTFALLFFGMKWWSTDVFQADKALSNFHFKTNKLYLSIFVSPPVAVSLAAVAFPAVLKGREFSWDQSSRVYLLPVTTVFFFSCDWRVFNMTKLNLCLEVFMKWHLWRKLLWLSPDRVAADSGPVHQWGSLPVLPFQHNVQRCWCREWNVTLFEDTHPGGC